MEKKRQLSIELSKEVDGLEMGVLADGTAFLSMRGLAKLCGIAVSTLSENCKAWLEGNRSGRFGQFVQRNGVGDASLYMRQEIAGSVVYVFSDQISTLFLEYYSFEAPNPTAQANYRTVARAGLKLFIYTALGYDPSRLVPPAWRHFHDRVSLASAPANYFSVFKETSEFVVNAIRAGLHVDNALHPRRKTLRVLQSRGRRRRGGGDHSLRDHELRAVRAVQSRGIGGQGLGSVATADGVDAAVHRLRRDAGALR